MSPALIACASLVLMLALIWAGMHVAVVLAVVSFIGVWLIRGDRKSGSAGMPRPISASG